MKSNVKTQFFKESCPKRFSIRTWTLWIERFLTRRNQTSRSNLIRIRVLGERLGISEDEVLARIAKLRQDGIIRRIGASINSRGLGFVSTLVCAKAPVESLEDFVTIINSYPGVTHNYLRKHDYNVWFTLIAESEAVKQQIIRDMSEKTGVELFEFPAKKIFKIRVDFKF